MVRGATSEEKGGNNMKKHNYCYKHDKDSCKDCPVEVHEHQCGYYCLSPFVEHDEKAGVGER